MATVIIRLVAILKEGGQRDIPGSCECSKGRFTYGTSPSTSLHFYQRTPRSVSMCHVYAEWSLSVYVSLRAC